MLFGSSPLHVIPASSTHYKQLSHSQYNVIITSPGGKAFEIFSYVCDEDKLSSKYGITIKDWSEYDYECADAHLVTSYSKVKV